MPILILCLLLAPAIAGAYQPAFVAPMDGTLAASPGPAPLETIGTISYDAGKFGQAAVLAPGAAVIYPTKGVVNKAAGTVSLWVCPAWNGNDDRSHPLLADLSDYNNRSQNTLYLVKDTRGLLRFELRSPSAEPVAADVRNWRAGEWHHVAATWSAASGVALYVDGLCAGRNQTPYEPVSWPRFILGGDWSGNASGDTSFDELRFYDRPLEAGPIAALRQGLALEEAAVTEIKAPKLLQPGVPFELQLKVTAAETLTRDYPVVVALDGVEVGTFNVVPASKHWPVNRPVDLNPVTLVLPDYLRLRAGTRELTARLEGAVPPANSGPAAAEARIVLPVPDRLGHTYAISEEGLPLRDRRPFIPRGPGEGYLYEGRFYRDDEEGRVLACELIRTGRIQEAFPCRLLDEVNCSATDHSFTEFGKSQVKEVIPGSYCRLVGLASTVQQKVMVDGKERPALPGFSYTLKTTAEPVPHVLVAELPDDRERVAEIALDAAPGSDLAPYLNTSGPGDTRLVSLSTVYTGGEYADTGRLFRHCLVFTPKSSASVVTVTSSSRQAPLTADGSAAVARLAMYQLLDVGAGLYNPINPPEEAPQRSVGLLLPENSLLFSQFGFAGLTAVQRRASLLAVSDYLKLVGINRLEFEPLGFAMNAYYSGSRLVNTSGYDLFAELLAVAESEGLQLVPLLDAMAYYDQLPEFTADSFQLDRDGKTVRQSYGKVPDPLRPEVQSQFLGFLSEFLEQVRGKTCVPYVAFRVDGVAGTCYSGDGPSRPPEEAGYSEWDLAAFEQDTGVRVGGTAGDTPSRYAWLREHPDLWARWISWRCERTRDLWLKARDLVVSRGDNRQLLVQTSLPSVTPGKYSYWHDHNTPPRDILRNHGYDPGLFTAEKGLRISNCLAVGGDRYLGEDLNKKYFYQDLPEDFYRTAEGNETEIYFNYWALPDHPRGYRVGPASPPGRAFFEPLIHALRTTNPYSLTFTNWYPGTLGHEFDLRRFIRAYRALPAVPPTEFTGEVYPDRGNLVVQWYGRERLALINDSPEPRRVRLTFPKALPFGTHITDLGSGIELEQMLGRSKTRVEVVLEPWDLVTLEVKELPASSITKPRSDAAPH